MDIDPIVEMENVVAGYGAMTILNGTSFKIARGAITTVIGPNGAGKSTMFKTIFGLLRPRSGIVRVAGREAMKWSQRELLAAGVCYIPQGRNIFPQLSVRHNIELGAVAAGPDLKDMPARLEAALDRFRRCGARPTGRPPRCPGANRNNSKSCAVCCSIRSSS